MSAAAWVDCLDLFEAHLRQQRSALAEGRPDDITAFVPPEPLGGLPGHLRSRAEHVAVQAHQLEVDLSAALAGVSRHVQLLSVLSTQDRHRPAAYVDHLG